jgi:hypothetical protein
MAKNLLVGAVKSMKRERCQNILAGGDTGHDLAAEKHAEP